jgi:DNA-binding Lrp family transcriptional regulator
MLIGRMHIKGNPQELWDYILENINKWDYLIKPLYLTHRLEQGDISLIVDTKNISEFHNLLTEKMATNDLVKNIRIIHMIEPTFFDVPSDLPPSLVRYTINIQTEPNRYREIFEAIKNMEPEKNIVPTLIAFTHHEYGGDIVLSILGTNLETAKSFVNSKIFALEGVSDANITSVKTKMLKADFSLVTKNEISGCGFVCSECIKRATDICPGCSKDSPYLKDCLILECVTQKGITVCLECKKRLACHKMEEALIRCDRHQIVA